MNSKYNPHLWHTVFPVLLLFISMAVTIKFPRWETVLLFITNIIISIILIVWIAIIGKIRAEEDYWFWIGNAVEELSKAEPEVWEAMGFTNPPHYAHLETDEVPKKSDGEPSPYYSTQYANVPLSPAVLQVFADGILSGRKKLSETSWSGVIPGPKFRKFQDWMELKKLIAKVNPSAPTQGYIITEAGEQWLLQHASISVVGMGGQSYVRRIPVRSDTV